MTKAMSADVSLIHQHRNVELAYRMILVGARANTVDALCDVNYRRVRRIYKEVYDHSPPKGQMPSNPNFYIAWPNNVQASLFSLIYRTLSGDKKIKRVDPELLTDAYELFKQRVDLADIKQALSFERCWILLRFMIVGEIKSRTCSDCGSDVIVHAYDEAGAHDGNHHSCMLCKPPAHAFPLTHASSEKSRPMAKGG